MPNNRQSAHTFEQVHIIINPAAGQDDTILNTLNRAFLPHDFQWKVAATKRTGDGARLAQQALSAGADCIAVYGGDGTLTDVINGIGDTDVPLAILPGGTGNAVAEKLGIPAQLKQAAALIGGESQQRAVDLGQVITGDGTNGYFVLRASIGLYNDMLDTATGDLKQEYGDLAYMMAGIQSLTDISQITFRLTIDGETIEKTGHTCMIANITRIGGLANFDFAPQVDPCDGRLDVFVFDTTSHDILAAMHSRIATDLSAFPQHWSGEEITIQPIPAQTIYTDGEPFCTCDEAVQIEIQSGAVNVLVPPESNANS